MEFKNTHQFSKKRGLCGNVAAMYGHNMNLECDVLVEMSAQMQGIGQDSRYPFGEQDYEKRRHAQTQHLCPQRKAWAREHAYKPAPTQSKELTEYYMAWYLWAVEENTGYAIYYPDGVGKFKAKPCTKEEYEAQQQRNAKAHLGEVTQLDS